VFTQEIDDHLKLSDRDELLSHLLGECVGSLGAMSGTLEVVEGGVHSTKRVIGSWQGETHVSADVHSNGNVVARVLLGPRLNAYPYDRDCHEKLGKAVSAVGMALDRIPARS
jgi:hypothetical protein